MRNTVLAALLFILIIPIAVPELFAMISFWNDLLNNYINDIVRYVLMALLLGGSIFFAIREFLDQRQARDPLRQKVFPIISSTYLSISGAMEAIDAKSEAHKIEMLLSECSNIRRLNKLLADYHHNWDTLAGYYLSSNSDKARVQAAQNSLDQSRERIYSWLGVKRETARK